MSSNDNRVSSHKRTDINLLLVEAYNKQLSPYDGSQSILHLILQQKFFNNMLETAGMTEIFYATNQLNPDKILLTSRQLQAARPTLAAAEALIRDQARLDCQESIIKVYDDLVAKNYIGLPYALLGIKYPNLRYTIDDHNQLVNPSASGSSSGENDGPHPDIIQFIEGHNRFFMGTVIPLLELAPLSHNPTKITFIQLGEAREIYINTQGMQGERYAWIRDASLPLPAHQKEKAEISYNKQLDTYQKQFTINISHKEIITSILVKCFSEHLLNVHINLLNSCLYAKFISTIHEQRYENMEDGVLDVMTAVNSFHIPTHLSWPDSRQVALDLLQLEYTQQMMIRLKEHFDITIHTQEAIRNAGGVKLSVDIVNAGEHVYYEDSTMFAKWRQFIDHPDTPSYYKRLYQADVDNKDHTVPRLQ